MDNGLISLPARADSPNVSVVRREAPLTLVAGVGSVPSNRAASPIAEIESARIGEPDIRPLDLSNIRLRRHAPALRPKKHERHMAAGTESRMPTDTDHDWRGTPCDEARVARH